MFKDLRNVTKHSSVYFLGNFISKIIGIILLPLYTKVILVEAYGIYSIFEVTIQFGQSILHFGIPNAIFRWLNLEEYKNKRGSIIFTSQLFLLGITCIIILLAFIFKNNLSILCFQTIEYELFFPVIAIILGLSLLLKIPLALIRIEEKSLLYISITISRFILQLVFTIYFVAILKIGIIGIFYGQLIGEIVAVIGLLIYMINKVCLRFEYKILKDMISFGFPLTFSDLSNRILNMGDRYILGFLTNVSVVGVYSLGYKLANLIDTLIINSFRTAFIPIAWKKFKEHNAKRFYAKLLIYYTFIVFWISLFIAVYAKGIIHTLALNKSYWDASNIVAIVVLAIAVKGTSSIIKMGLQFTKKTKLIAYIVLSAAALNIILNFLLIPLTGMYGAAFSTLISFLYIAFVTYFVSNKYYPITFEWIRLLKILFTSLLLYFISYLLNPLSFIWRIVLKFVLLCTYPIILYLICFFQKQEISRIKGAWKKWKSIKNIHKNVKSISL